MGIWPLVDREASARPGAGAVPVVIRGLRKDYGSLRAVRGVDLEIPGGRVFGLLGPNGAGKTTTIRMLCGLSRPSRGSATVMGIDVGEHPERVRAVMGIVPQSDVLDRDLTVRDNLVYHARLHRMVPRSYEPRILEVLELVGLLERQDEWPLNLSGGMRRRFTIAKALLHEPAVLVLDEPTTGLDPQSRRLIWEKLAQLSGRGITILLTTHHMEEAEELCAVIAVIDGGRIIARGSPGMLRKRYGGRPTVVASFIRRPPAGLVAGLPPGASVCRRGNALEVRTERPMEVVRTLLDAYGPGLRSLSVREPSLEEVFLNLTGRRLRQ